MKKNTLYLIIAIISLYIAWRTFRINKDIRDTQRSMAQPETEPADPNGVPAPIPTAYGREKVVTTIEDCPYCGTSNAEITRTYKNGKVIKMSVVCPYKSCPGPYGKVKKAEIVANDSKLVKAKTER